MTLSGSTPRGSLSRRLVPGGRARSTSTPGTPLVENRSGNIGEVCRTELFRGVFLLVAILAAWLFSLLPAASHVVLGDRHVFAVGWGPWLVSGAAAFLLVGLAELARRWMKDRLAAISCFLMIPLIAVALVPDFLMTRVEVTAEGLSYRRAWPHTRFNADIAWEQMSAASQRKQESPGIFWVEHKVSYLIVLKDGGEKELPSSEVLVAAHEKIDQALSSHKIPLVTEAIPIEKN
jgi:hypothetical protein